MRVLSVWLLCLLSSWLTVPVMAASEAPTSSSLERFIDGVMERAIVTQATVGATVSVVQNGRLVVARGYGLSDAEQNIPVESRVTQFRIGSISKVLVWISVLQLVEAGKLDLDADINAYLTKFTMPSDFTDPITLRHLMTHTPGLEDKLTNLFVTGPRQVGILSETLAANMPRRVALPGSLVAYSNYGAALAGHIVELASGMAWDDYAEAHILKPLGMTGATTRQPVPEAIDATRSKGYTREMDQLQEQPFMYVSLAPAGASTATSLDMARLMVELLNPRSTSILSDKSKRQLLGGAYVNSQLVNGVTLGMYEMSRGGARAVGHGGNTMLFNSLMVLWPDENMGLFVSTNTLSAQNVADDLVSTVSSYLGLTQKNIALQAVTNPLPYVGDYLSTRRNHSDSSKILGLADTAQVAYDAETETLLVTDVLGLKRYRQLDEHVFQHVGGFERLGFKVTGGKATELFFSNRPIVSYARAGLAERVTVAGLVLILWAVFAAGVLLVWPFSWLSHRQDRAAQGQLMLSIIVVAAAAVALAMFVQLAARLGGPLELMLGGFGTITALLWYPVVLAVLVFAQLLYLFRVWTGGYWWVSRRLHFTVLLVAQCALLWWLWYWNLFPPTVLQALS